MAATAQDSRGGVIGRAGRWLPLLGGSGLLLYGLARRSLAGLALAAAGGGLAYRGIAGMRTQRKRTADNRLEQGERGRGITVERAVTINKPADELYRFWRDFENLPRFMTHLESVRVTDGKHSHWVAKGPAGKTVEWDAEVTAEREHERIAWRSLEGADVASTGSVSFTPATGGRGTEVRVEMTYQPPGGRLGVAAAKLFRQEPSQQVADDLWRLKQIMEAGEIASTEGQPAGGNRKKDE